MFSPYIEVKLEEPTGSSHIKQTPGEMKQSASPYPWHLLSADKKKKKKKEEEPEKAEQVKTVYVPVPTWMPVTGTPYPTPVYRDGQGLIRGPDHFPHLTRDLNGTVRDGGGWPWVSDPASAVAAPRNPPNSTTKVGHFVPYGSAARDAQGWHIGGAYHYNHYEDSPAYHQREMRRLAEATGAHAVHEFEPRNVDPHTRFWCMHSSYADGAMLIPLSIIKREEWPGKWHRDERYGNLYFVRSEHDAPKF